MYGLRLVFVSVCSWMGYQLGGLVTYYNLKQDSWMNRRLEGCTIGILLGVLIAFILLG